MAVIVWGTPSESYQIVNANPPDSAAGTLLGPNQTPPAEVLGKGFATASGSTDLAVGACSAEYDCPFTVQPAGDLRTSIPVIANSILTTICTLDAVPGWSVPPTLTTTAAGSLWAQASAKIHMTVDVIEGESLQFVVDPFHISPDRESVHATQLTGPVSRPASLGGQNSGWGDVQPNNSYVMRVYVNMYMSASTMPPRPPDPVVVRPLTAFAQVTIQFQQGVAGARAFLLLL